MATKKAAALKLPSIINGVEIKAEFYAFDECHKIYILESEADIKEAESMGYKIYPIKGIRKTWQESCALRFISTWGLKIIVPQGSRRKIQIRIPRATLKLAGEGEE